MAVVKRLSLKAFSWMLALSSLMTLGMNGVAHAAAQTCVWTGATSNVMNVATNWSNCSGGVPLTGDIISFPTWNGTPDTDRPTVVTLNNNLGHAVGGLTSTSSLTDNYYHIANLALTDGATMTSNNMDFFIDNLTSTGSVTLGPKVVVSGGTVQGTVTPSGTGPFIYGLTAANVVVPTGAQMNLAAPKIGDPNPINFANMTVQNGALVAICSTASTQTDFAGTLTLGGGTGANPSIGISPCMGDNQQVVVSGGLKLKGNVVLLSDATISASSNNISVDGSLTSNGHVLSVNINGTSSLMGSGTTGNVTVSSGGLLAPGHSPGCLTVSNLTLSGSYQAQLGGTTPCTGYDQTTVSGTTTLTGGTLDVQMYNGFVPVAGQQFTLINNTSANPITGAFNNLPEGATFTAGGVTFKITYVGGDGNDVVITVVSAPGTPDTGYSIVSAHPGVVLTVSALAALLIVAVARKRAPKAAHRR